MARLDKDRDKEKGVNVQVLLRCRPFNEEELLSNAPQVITCHDSKREVSVSQNIAGKQLERTFIYDKVFGPQSQQKDLYDQAITPIVNEVLEGFNCTIFAYGQTGTGKTYTMEGSGKRSQNEELPPDAGVIPRAIKQIFETLELQNAEYSVKVTFLELYNEETTDLLAPEELCRVPDDKRRPLTLMEDGKGGVIVRGLEEVIVTNSTEIFNLLDRGSAKRRTAETLLNKQSSRSHSIFSITIHIKESTPEGEDLMKCGKLNLVDLAGSENICRSGAREGRAREAGEINKSLLTLGRVITSLVEHLGHVPYRDSKLTRLLRDSLGGRTKTCIIATVSPSVHCLEETMSTLDYAQRAKNIKNKPEVNQKLMKTTLIKELYAEIERLKTELHASREKNGVYIPKDRFYQEEADKKTMAMKIEQVEDELESNRKLLEEMQSRYESELELCNNISAHLQEKQKDLKDTKDALIKAREDIRIANEKIVERDFIISNQRQCESVLLEKTNDVRVNFEQTAQDVIGLFTKLDRKKQIDVHNTKTLKNFQSELAKCLNALQKDIVTSVRKQQEDLTSIDNRIRAFMSSKKHSTERLKLQMDDLKLVYFSRLQCLQELVQSHESNANSMFQKLNNTSSDHATTLQDLLHEAIVEAELIVQDIQNTLTKQQNEIAIFAQQQKEGVQKNILATKVLCKSTFDAFDQLGNETADIFHCIEECGLVQEHSLSEFEKTFEEQAREEEQQMLEDITSLLTKSKVRRSAKIRDTVSCLREQASSERHAIKDSLNKVKSLTLEARSGCESFINHSEAYSSEDLRKLGASHCQLEMLVQNCFKSVNETSNLWGKVQTRLAQCTKDHTPAIESIVRESKDINASLRSEFKTEISATQEEIEAGNNHLYEQMHDCVTLDEETGNTLQCSISSQLSELATLQSCHSTLLEELQSFSDHSFSDIKEDQPTSMTPMRRNIHVPSKDSIDELRAPKTEIILTKYREKKYSEGLSIVAKEDKAVDCENPTNKPSSQVYHVLPTRIPLARLN